MSIVYFPRGTDFRLRIVDITSNMLVNMPSDQNFMFPAVEYDIEYSTSMVLGQPLKYKQIISHGWNV
jgi:hypothetical protein